MKRFLSWLIKPYNPFLCYTILIWFLISSTSIYKHFCHNDYIYCIYLSLMYYFAAFLISLLVNTSNYIGRILRPMSISIFTLFFLLNTYCLNKFHCTLNPDITAIIKGTNLTEAKEFASTFISLKDILFCALCVLIIFIINRGGRLISVKRFADKIYYAPLALLIIAFIAIIRNKDMVSTELRADNNWMFNTEEIIDLRQHRKNPTILATDSIHPTNIIILLGESFSKNHSSLYGYEKQTNPQLQQLQNDSSLILFSKAQSPAANTTKAFKYLLNNHTRAKEEKGERWYNSTTIIEALKSAGYHTTWISNQSENGMFDNLPSGHSKICDNSIFNNTGVEKLDDFLLSVNTDSITSKHPLNFIIYHFMGQHEAFDKRYPDSFNQFKAVNYPNAKTNQRQTLADYDNATLFNDYVVAQLMRKYSESKSILIYFPDHSLDIFDTSDDYFGHARPGDFQSLNHCLDIPFMIYVSPCLKEFPRIKEKVLKIKDNEINTENLMDIVLSISGWKIL